MQPTLKHGGSGIMVWGCMSESGVGELILVTGIVCAKDYVSLLQNALPKSVHSLGLYVSSSRTVLAATQLSIR